MAVLVSQDWQPPQDHTMDALPSQSSPINPSVPRQRSSPANDQQPPNAMSNQQPYPYPVQQQQAAWSPAHSPQQFYPNFYQNQPSYPMHGHGPHPSQQPMHAQNPYYDPTNNQYAQWAYQQMIYNAQQAHQMSHVPQHMGSQRGRSASTGEYFAINQLPGFNPFPSGTPPPHPSQLPNGGYSSSSDQQHPPQYQGFHPYRRPPRQGSSAQDQVPNGEWRPPPQAGSFQPPYVRADAAGSSSSINSSSSHSGSQRQRTNSNQSSPASPPPSHHGKPSSSSSGGSGGNHARGGSTSTSASSQQQPQASSATSSLRAHGRTSSTSSTSSGPRGTPTSAPSTTAASHGATLRKPSPLSQGTFTAAEKRMSRDDSDLAAMLEPNPNAPGVRSGGLKGRLRRALSLGANQTLHEEDEDEGDVAKSGSRAAPAGSVAGSSQATITGDDESTATVQKKKSRSLFNSRLNRSTDNISLSSTMSSASMVIRKLGNIGKLTRRNSLAGITSLFKDKKEKEEEEASGGKKSKKKKGEKGALADPSVSMATAELDRTEYSSPELAGLSPAARLARQHTLKSNAEAAAKAKAEAEARAAAAAAAAAQNAQTEVPTTWEKNTTSRQGEPGGSRRVNEDGMGLVDDNSDSGSDDGTHDHHPQSYSMDGWDDDEDWNEAQEDEDVTIRADFENATLSDQEEMEPWAVNVRRSVEKARKPAKGILKSECALSAWS